VRPGLVGCRCGAGQLFKSSGGANGSSRGSSPARWVLIYRFALTRERETINPGQGDYAGPKTAKVPRWGRRMAREVTGFMVDGRPPGRQTGLDSTPCEKRMLLTSCGRNRLHGPAGWREIGKQRVTSDLKRRRMDMGNGSAPSREPDEKER